MKMEETNDGSRKEWKFCLIVKNNSEPMNEMKIINVDECIVIVMEKRANKIVKDDID